LESISPSAVAAVIPCYNEERTIAGLVGRILLQIPKIIVVDDGSTDGTGELAKCAGAEVLRHDRNLGKGAALQTGWKRATELGLEYVLTLDGDGQHSADDIPRFFATRADLVVGNRMDTSQAIPWVRRQVNHCMSRRLSRSVGIYLPDSQCGFRLIRLKELNSLRLYTKHFEIESEVLLAFIRAGKRVEFVPIQVIYKSEQSKIHPLLDTARWFRWWRSIR